MTTTVKKLSSKELRTVYWMPPRSSGTSSGSLQNGRSGSIRKVTPQSIGAWLMSLRGDFLVSPSQLPESQEVNQTSGTCGPQQGEQLASYDRGTSSWKMFQGCLFTDMSGEYSGTWPKWGMMQDGVLSERTMLAHLIEGKGCGYTANWTTPSVCGNYNRKGASKTSGDGLATQVRQYPTPKGRDWKGKSQRGNYGNETDCLPNAVKGQLNPDWVEWLMNWPIGHSDLKPLTTLGRLRNVLGRIKENSKNVSTDEVSSMRENKRGSKTPQASCGQKQGQHRTGEHNDTLHQASHGRTHEGGGLGKRTSETSELLDMWERISAEAEQKGEDMQCGMPERNGQAIGNGTVGEWWKYTVQQIDRIANLSDTELQKWYERTCEGDWDRFEICLQNKERRTIIPNPLTEFIWLDWSVDPADGEPVTGMWLTPSTIAIEGGEDRIEKRTEYRNSIGRQYVPGCLAEQVKWLTPRATETCEDPKKFVARNGDRGEHCHGTLSSQVMWRTPSANEPGITPERLESIDGGELGGMNRHFDKETGRMAQIGLTQQVQLRKWPTPRAGNPGSRPNEKGGKILAEEVKKQALKVNNAKTNFKGFIPRVTTVKLGRINRLKAIGNGQVPKCTAMAWTLLTDGI